MTMNLSEIVFDDEIDPRKKRSPSTVEEYFNDLLGGAKFPALELQKVRYDGETKIVCLDGRHRIEAIQKFNHYLEQNPIDGLKPIGEIEYDFWKDEILDKDNPEHLEALRKEATKRNLKHGDRLKDIDLQFQLERILEARPIERIKNFQKEMADEFNYSAARINQLIGEEWKARQLSRGSIIFKLNLLGWTHQKIAESFDLGRTAITEIVKKLNAEFIDIPHQFYEKQAKIEDLCRLHKLDTVTLWAILLQEKSDLERFQLFFGNDKYFKTLYSEMVFSERDSRLGVQYPGNVPGQIAMNIIRKYTDPSENENPKARVVDPMAGGGSTIDACLILGRYCQAYDINSIRKDIVKWDLWKGYPEGTKKCDLIFLDPPYWNLNQGLYVEESISEVDFETWYSFMEHVAIQSFATVKKGGYVSLLLQPMVDQRGDKQFRNLPRLCGNQFEEAGFEEIRGFSVPLSTQVKKGRDVNFAKANDITLDVSRWLSLWRKP